VVDGTSAEDVMFEHTDLPRAPWTVVNGNDKRRARLEAMRYVLSVFSYSGRRDEIVGAADPLIVGSPALLEGLPAAGSRAHDATSSSDGPDVAAHPPQTRTNAG
jgi:Polyphosphate kinase 2 (PPK2)